LSPPSPSLLRLPSLRLRISTRLSSLLLRRLSPLRLRILPPSMAPSPLSRPRPVLLASPSPVTARAMLWARNGDTHLSSSAAASALFLVRVVVFELLSSRTAIGILVTEIDNVLLAETALCLDTGCHRLWKRHRDARLIACQNLLAAEVAAIGNDFELVNA